MTWTVRTAQLAFLALFSVSLFACGKGEKGGIFSVDQKAHVESLAPKLPASVVAYWRAELPESELEALLNARPDNCPEQICDAAQQWLEGQAGQRVLVGADYELSPAAQQLTELLGELRRHALPRARFQVDTIDTLQSALLNRTDDENWAAKVLIEEPLIVAAGLHFREHSRRQAADPEGVAKWMAKRDELEIKSVRDAFEHKADELEQQANALEWLLTLAWLEYVNIMNASNVHYWDEQTLLEIGLVVIHPDHMVDEDELQNEDELENNELENEDVVVNGVEAVVTLPKTIAASRADVPPEEIALMTNVLRQRRLNEEVLILGTDTLKERAAALEPPFEHYAALKQAFADYLELAAAGGWLTDLDVPREVRAGQRHKELPRLRERLRAEGFEVEHSDSTLLDADLSAILKDYQFTHQLEEDGYLSLSTVSSMNRSVETRLGEIAVAMQEWRLNPIGRDHAGYRIEINVPDFHSEVWDGEELLSRFRVVVGRFAREDATVQTKTPMFSDRLSRIVLNPYWNVPQSIVIHELLPKLEEDPEYLERNNYEMRERGSRTFIRQLPGPWNALGQVKFLFPNEYAVYMHDTPSKRLFGRSIRAFSHGCIRVQDPMGFAELLISRDREWTLRETKNFIKRAYRRNEGESYVNLDYAVPVHLYYVGVNVVNGRPHFLADIYRKFPEAIEESAALVPEWLELAVMEETPTMADGLTP